MPPGSCLTPGLSDFAAGRAYYAMLYVAQALLAERGERFRKHSGVHSVFGERFAKTGVLDPKFHRWLLDAFDRRILGDYDLEFTASADEVREMVRQAQEFRAAATAYLTRS